MDIILQVLSALFVVLWTARLARNKGRNILLWAGAAAIPAVAVYAIAALPDAVTILCMAPMVALVFMPSRRPVAAEGEADTAVSCPRCQHSHEPGPSFCTNCGWELTRPYAATETAGEAAVETPEPTLASSAAGVRSSAEPAGAMATAAEALAGAEKSAEPAGVGAQVASPETAEAEPPPAFSAMPLQITRPLTAAGMTESGIALIQQGRIREAVDQFTKAIALDPRYREAWEQRAIAYTALGLKDKAAADRQQLEGIQGGGFAVPAGE